MAYELASVPVFENLTRSIDGKRVVNSLATLASFRHVVATLLNQIVSLLILYNGMIWIGFGCAELYSIIY